MGKDYDIKGDGIIHDSKNKMKYRIRYKGIFIVFPILIICVGYFLFSLLTDEITNNNSPLFIEETVAVVDSSHAVEATNNKDSLFTWETVTTVNSSPVEEATIISVSVLDEVVARGEQCTISIVVEPGKAIAGMQFSMSFDPSLVSIDSVEEGDLLKQNGASTYFNSGVLDNESGVIRAVYSAIISPGEVVSTEGTFAIIRLTARTTKTICPFTLSNVIVGDSEGKSVPVKLVNGELEIS